MNSELKIDLIPFCGLGNRLNVMSSAIALLKQKDYDITVFWDKTSDCFAWWEELFLPVEGLEVRHREHFYHLRRGKQYLYLPRLLRLFVYDCSLKARKILDSDILITPPAKWKKLYVEGNKRFCPFEETSMLSRYYRPIPQIQERIDAFTSQYGEYTVGVHVRRTDHADVIKNNPLESYVALMQEELAQHPEAKFYIASDDETVKQYMRDQFPGRILTLDISLSRQSEQGMRDAVLELFCLGKTNLIIGSRGSTYSELAAKLYDTPVKYK